MLLESLIKKNASELRLRTGEEPRVYLDKTFHSLSTRPLDSGEIATYAKMLAPSANQLELDTKGKTSFRFSFGDVAHFFVRMTRRGDLMEMIVRPF